MGTLRKGDGSVTSGVPFLAQSLSCHHGRNDPETTLLPIAFQPRYYTRDNKTGGAPSETADITNAHKAGDSAPVLAFDWQSGGDVRLNVSDKATSALQKSQTPAVVTWDNGQGNPNAQVSETAYPLNTQCNQGVGVRRFTPAECEKLQGFPPGWTAHDAQGAPISDSARYRMLGNAVAVPVVEWLGRRIVLQENAK